MACFRELVLRGYSIHCVRWDQNKKTPYEPNNEEGIFFYKRSTLDVDQMIALATTVDPVLLLASGWMDKGYLKVCKSLKGKIPTVSGLDNWWKGSLKQRIGAMLSFWMVKPYFSHLFVPGAYQYTFARKLGYKDAQILKGLYTCDQKNFSAQTLEILDRKKDNFPKTLLFVGRYTEIKGIVPFVTAFKEIANQLPDWKLELYGNGDLKNQLLALATDQIAVNDFVAPEQLKHAFANAGVFCLPSLHEPWGLVIHEATCSGLPLLVSTNIGACTVLLKEHENGLCFDVADSQSIKAALLAMCGSSPQQLLDFSKKSFELSQSLNPVLWADELLSVL